MTRALTYFEGRWEEGNVPLMGATDHATWLSSVVFDGARAFRRQAPDLDLHCARAVESARTLGLMPTISAGEIIDLAWDGIERFPPEAELYIRPLFFASGGFILPDPDSTRFALTLFDLPLPPANGFSACISRYRRPSPETAPTNAKASCLYPNVARMYADAKERGFEAAVVLDLNGNVAEFYSSNLFLARDGVAATPIANGTFLNGVTRRRVMQLLREDGIKVEERTIAVADLLAADEVFSTGNYGKVLPATRIEHRDFQPGPVYARARELYFAYAATCTRPKRARASA